MKTNYKKIMNLLKPVFVLVLVLTSSHVWSQAASFTSPTGAMVSGTLTNPVSSGTMCTGVYTFTNTSTAATNYTWSATPSASVIISNANAASPTFTFNNTTLVTYTISLIANTSASPNSTTGQVIKVVARPNPILSASSNSFCSGASTTLSVSPAYANYLWSNSATTQTTTATPTVSTMYSFTTTLGGINGFPLCTATNTINITVNPNPVILISNSPTLICSGQTASMTATSNPASTYTWSTGSNSSFIFVTPTTTTTYTLNGTSVAGCPGTATITQSVSNCTDIKSVNSQNNAFNIYPNPTNGEIFISMAGYEENVVIELFNSLGELIAKETAKDAFVKIDLSENKTGIYHVVITKSGQHQNAFKVIKN